jgi:hypothetical protein
MGSRHSLHFCIALRIYVPVQLLKHEQLRVSPLFVMLVRVGDQHFRIRFR